MFICQRCSKEVESYDYLRKHVSRVHKIHSSEFYVEYYLNGVWPTCKCGCGERVKWRTEMPTKFMEYVAGHNSRTSNPMQGKTHSNETKHKISKIAKDGYESGKRVVWAEGLSIDTDIRLQSAAKKNSENVERSKKISDYMTGRPKSEEHKRKSREGIIKAWSDPELQERQRQHMLRRMTNNTWSISSKLEDTLAALLDSASITYTRQFYVKSIKAFYDFYLPESNIIVEVHGNFWHCNPATKHAIPKFDSQHTNISNDVKKAQWCMDNNIRLLIFWETDILTRPEWVIEQLEKYINSHT